MAVVKSIPTLTQYSQSVGRKLKDLEEKIIRDTKHIEERTYINSCEIYEHRSETEVRLSAIEQKMERRQYRF